LGADSIVGGDGIDLVQFNNSALRRNFTLVVSDSFMTPDGSMITGVERVDHEGSVGVDLITGGAYGDIIDGNGGADQLLGMGGNDTLIGNGFGRNGPVAAVLLGGAGNDFISYSQFSGGERIEGGAGIDVLEFTLPGLGVVFSAASLRGTYQMANGATLGGFERVDMFATNGADKVRGGAFGDTIVGLLGNDTIYGGGGADELYGGGGNERLYGGAGNDRLFCVSGSNVVLGGLVRLYQGAGGRAGRPDRGFHDWQRQDQAGFTGFRHCQGRAVCWRFCAGHGGGGWQRPYSV